MTRSLGFGSCALAALCSGLFGCAQVDLVAVRRLADTCPEGSDCAPTCRSFVCEAVTSRDSLCASQSAPARVGDSCTDGASALVASRYALCSCSDFVSASSVTVNAYTDTPGNPRPGDSRVGVNGDLTLASASDIDGVVELFGSSPTVDLPVTTVPSPPCRCTEESFLDVAGEVAARRRDNDNASLGLSEVELAGFMEPRALTLECGRYYFTRIAGSERLTLTARGNVAIYVDGNIELDDALDIQSERGGQVSLFVAGEVRVSGSFALGGTPSTQASSGLYAQSQGVLDFGGSVAIVGALYAPRAELTNRGPLEIYGSLFVRRAAPSADVTIHYDTRNAEPQPCR